MNSSHLSLIIRASDNSRRVAPIQLSAPDSDLVTTSARSDPRNSHCQLHAAASHDGHAPVQSTRHVVRLRIAGELLASQRQDLALGFWERPDYASLACLPLHHQDLGADLQTGIGVQVEVPEERLHAKLRGA